MSATTEQPPIHALIFDMDGLLVDSEPLSDLALTTLLAQHDCVIDWSDPDLTARMMGRRMPEIVAACAEICGLTASVAEMHEAVETLRIDAVRGHLLPFPGAHDLLAFAREAGLRLALATSGRRDYVDAVLAETGLRGSFDVEVTGEEVTRGKPDPQVYQLAASRLGVAPAQCVVLEDAPNGIAAAVAAGMWAVAVPNTITRDLPFSPPPTVTLPHLQAVEAWLQTQGIAPRRVTTVWSPTPATVR